MIKKLFPNLKKKTRNKFLYEVIMISNVIQFDEMGYPLRLIMVKYNDGTVDHLWRDSYERENDVVLEWEGIPIRDEEK